jgi:hypothetical protein
MAQFPLNELLNGTRHFFSALKAKKNDGTYDTVKITDAGELVVTNTGSSTFRGSMLSVPSSGNRVQFPNFPCRQITIIAKKSNQGSVYIGGLNVSPLEHGAELEAKDSITLAVNNTNLIHIDVDVSGDGVTYVAI